MATDLAMKTEEAKHKSVKWSTVNSKRFLQNCLRMVTDVARRPESKRFARFVEILSHR